MKALKGANNLDFFGEQSGELKKARETTLALLEMGMSVKQIAKAVNLSVETIQNWISEAYN